METLVKPKPVSQTKTAKSRIAYIDQIKVFLTCLVVAHHAAQAYGPTGGIWLVNDPEKATWMKHLFFINASFMMGLYFFISGYFMLFSISRKTDAAFMKDRLKRLGIPLFVFTFLVFLPFNYVGSGSNQNIIAFFLDTYWNKPPIATGHLWFVASLLVYTGIYLVVFKKRRHASPVNNKPLKAWYIPAYIILLTIVSALVRLKYPIDAWRTWLIPVEVAHIPQYLSLFLIGAFFNHHGWLDQLKLKTGGLYLLIAGITYFLNERLPATVSDYWLTESLVESLLCVGIGIGMLTVFRHYSNRTSTLTQLLSNNAYGIYLFHLFIVIGFQHLFLEWKALPTVKFIAVTVLSILASLLVSALIRKNRMISTIV